MSCSFTFANTKVHQIQSSFKIYSTVSTDNTNNFESCTVTVIKYSYDAEGNVNGTQTGTATYSSSSNSGWNCAFAHHLAEQAAINAPVIAP